VKLGQPWTGEIAPGHFRVGTTYVGCYVVEEAGAYNLVDTGESGPRLLPRFVNDDHQQALASLHKLELVKAGWVLPGHGPPWEGSPQQAVKLAREIAAPRR
jgi:glyoxylase-like metal-dependent hydrolase (beta-lactamase superfamily II)